MPAAEAARLKLAITSHLAVTVPDPEQEYLANVAAAELLMPLTQFRKHAAVPPSLDALIHLCHLFGASKAAVLNRIKETDTRWDCAALYWKPILGHGCVDGFRIARRVTFGRFQSKTFVPGTTSRLDGLFLSQRTGRRSSALYDGVTIESVGYGDGGQAGVWSLATNQSLHKRLQAS